MDDRAVSPRKTIILIHKKLRVELPYENVRYNQLNRLTKVHNIVQALLS
jgi:hypothetical protein